MAIGDVIGETGTLFLRRRLPALRSEKQADLVIVNGENSARGNGISPESAEMIFASGADVITTGNHVFRQKNAYELIENSGSILRPANFPDVCPGRGYLLENFAGVRTLIMNLQGTLFMEALASPFETCERILEREKGRYDVALCDFHAEATSEKAAFARHFDSRLSAVFGTHTHVPTADLTVFPGGTGFITDLGMCGAKDSVLGMDAALAATRFLTHMPTPFRAATGPCRATGALFEIDPQSGNTLFAEFVTLEE